MRRRRGGKMLRCWDFVRKNSLGQEASVVRRDVSASVGRVLFTHFYQHRELWQQNPCFLLSTAAHRVIVLNISMIPRALISLTFFCNFAELTWIHFVDLFLCFTCNSQFCPHLNLLTQIIFNIIYCAISQHTFISRYFKW